MTRRERAVILGDILDHLDQLRRNPAHASLTRLAARANLPHGRLAEYLDTLRACGLVTDTAWPALTDRGGQYLECYRAWVRIQILYGLGPPQVDAEGVVLVGPLKPAAKRDPGSPALMGSH